MRTAIGFRRLGTFVNRGTWLLTEYFSVDQFTIVRRLKKLVRCGNWLDVSLTNSQIPTNRVQIFTGSLQRNDQSVFLTNLITGKEPLLLFKKRHKKESLCISDETPKETAKDDYTKKAMCCHLLSHLSQAQSSIYFWCN